MERWEKNAEKDVEIREKDRMIAEVEGACLNIILDLEKIISWEFLNHKTFLKFFWKNQNFPELEKLEFRDFSWDFL